MGVVVGVVRGVVVGVVRVVIRVVIRGVVRVVVRVVIEQPIFDVQIIHTFWLNSLIIYLAMFHCPPFQTLS